MKGAAVMLPYCSRASGLLLTLLGLAGVPAAAQPATLTTGAAMRDVQVRRAGYDPYYPFWGGVQPLYVGDCVRVSSGAGASAWVRYASGSTHRIRPGGEYCLETAPANSLRDRVAAAARRAAGAVVTLFTTFGEGDPQLIPLVARGPDTMPAVLLLPDDGVWLTASDRPALAWFYGSGGTADLYRLRLYAAGDGCRPVGAPLTDVTARSWLFEYPAAHPALARGGVYRAELWGTGEGARLVDAGCFQVGSASEATATAGEVATLREAFRIDGTQPGEDPAETVYVAAYLDERGATLDAAVLLHRDVLARAATETSAGAVQALQRMLTRSGASFSAGGR